MTGEHDEGAAPNAAVEKQARALGWVPEAEFRGDKAKWSSAEQFIERADQLMPILRQNNKRLQAELLTRDAKLDTVTQQLTGALSAIDKLEKHYTEANKRAVEIARQQLKDEYADADPARQLEIQEELADIRERERAATATPTTPAKKDTPTYEDNTNPEFKEWSEEHKDWYGVDKKRTKTILRIAEDLKDEGETLTGRPFLDKCFALLEEQESGQSDDTPPSKVEGGTAPRQSARGGGKSWNDLPADAKQACLGDAEDLVGPNKRYKTLDEWKKRYTSIYFSED